MPKQKVELDVEIKPEYDYSNIPDEQLENIINLQEAARLRNDDDSDENEQSETA